MRINQFDIAPATRDTLDDRVLIEAVARLHSVGDCGDCHLPLGATGRFSLITADSGTTISVTAAHAHCSAPCHRTDRPSLVSLDTYRVLPAVLPTGDGAGGPTDMLPIVLTNPAIDTVDIRRAPDGTLSVTPTPHALHQDGWRRFDTDDGAERHAVGTCHLIGGSLLTLTSSRFGAWESEVPDEFGAGMDTWAGCYAGITFRRLIDDVAACDDPMRMVWGMVEDHDLWVGHFARET
ncbi:MAG: hypothetical protein L0H93_16040 [Nocardioides sp.]|nr:hypothetical protein [Nocardioides sp.]